MKIFHRVPVPELTSDEISPEYQAEVDRSTGKLERQHAQALKRLEAAERRAVRIESVKAPKPKPLALAWAEVEARRQELGRIELLMRAGGAAAKNRGRASFHPVPTTKGVPL